jgi:hypothetical protein
MTFLGAASGPLTSGLIGVNGRGIIILFGLVARLQQSAVARRALYRPEMTR